MKGFIVFILINLVIYPLLGQQTISKEEALEIALEKNFGIQVSKNNLEISKNNSSLVVLKGEGTVKTQSIKPGEKIKVSQQIILDLS